MARSPWLKGSLPTQSPHLTPGLGASIPGRQEGPSGERQGQGGARPEPSRGPGDPPTSLPLLIPMPKARAGGRFKPGRAQGSPGLGRPAGVFLYSRHSQHDGCDG